MKWVWGVFALSMVVGFWFTPPLGPGEALLAYVLAGRETWQSTAASVVAGISGAFLLMAYLMRPRA